MKRKKTKKPNKNKILHQINQLEISIAGCSGCSECQDSHVKLKELKNALYHLNNPANKTKSFKQIGK